MNQSSSPISQQLIKLAVVSLDDELKLSQLEELIEKLFSQIGLGHSCYNFIDYKKQQLNYLVKLLLDSQLASLILINDQALPVKPLTIVEISNKEYLLYVTRYLYYEKSIAKKLAKLINPPVFNNDKYLSLIERFNLNNEFPNKEQLQAIKNSCQNQYSIITGGPGTGKTTSVVLLLWLLTNLYSETNLKIHICAPTGKAAARVQESIQSSLTNITNFDFGGLIEYFISSDKNCIEFSTIHKLLGAYPDNIYFKHNESNPLDVDILIVDESSMVGLPLFHKLLDAINPLKTKHIIFLGDKNQLSSVEEGYVFASIVDKERERNNSQDLFSPIQTLGELVQSKRNNQKIGFLADLVLSQDSQGLINELHSQNSIYKLDLRLLLNNLFSKDTNNLLDYVKFLKLTNYDTEKIFAKFAKLGILCLLNEGIYGVNNLNLQIEKRVKLILQTNQNWYHGRPIIILENDYSLEVFNGDIGICQIINDKPLITFKNGKVLIPEILPRHQLAYAITIHKAQGSEFNNVNIIINKVSDEKMSLLNCELIYTAITRAKNNLFIYADTIIIEYAVNNRTLRNTGIKNFLI